MFPAGTFRLGSLQSLARPSHGPSSAQSGFEAPNQACQGQQEEGATKQSVTEKKVKYFNYTSATTQATQADKARGNAATVQVPYLSHKPKKSHLRRLRIRRTVTKEWKRVNKHTQVSENLLKPARKPIIGFSFEPPTSDKMSLTKVDEKKLDGKLLQGRVQTQLCFHESLLSYKTKQWLTVVLQRR